MVSQAQKVVGLLKYGRTLTQKEANRYGITNLRARVSELRSEGVQISSDFYTTREGGRAARYSFAGKTIRARKARKAAKSKARR